MARFHGYRNCDSCNTENASGHFLDLDEKRLCLPCYVSMVKPDHDGIAAMTAARDEALKAWKCQKWKRSDSKLPNGPYSS